MTKLLGLVAPYRTLLTILAALGAAAFIYHKFAALERDRDALHAFATAACATAGAPFDASVDQVRTAGGKVRQVARDRGELCRARLLALAAFERDATKASNEALAGALQRNARKSEADAATAANGAAAAAAAAHRMEQAENDVPQDDRVGRSWFDAVNGIAGLRAPAD